MSPPPRVEHRASLLWIPPDSDYNTKEVTFTTLATLVHPVVVSQIIYTTKKSGLPNKLLRKHDLDVWVYIKIYRVSQKKRYSFCQYKPNRDVIQIQITS